MSTAYGQSGGPVWSQQFDRYPGQYMVVGINSWDNKTSAGCVANWATFMGPAQAIELAWHISLILEQLQPRGPSLVGPLLSDVHQNADIVADYFANPPPQVKRGIYNGQPEKSELFLFAKIVAPSDASATTPPLYSLVSTTYLVGGANPISTGWASLASDPAATGDANQACQKTGGYQNGCGMLVLTRATDQTFTVPATINLQLSGPTNNLIAIQFLYQTPVVWANMPPPATPPTTTAYPNLQTTQVQSPLWLTTTKFY